VLCEKLLRQMVLQANGRHGTDEKEDGVFTLLFVQTWPAIFKHIRGARR
jgi:hypothetical protein